jgi:hypothetical protein
MAVGEVPTRRIGSSEIEFIREAAARNPGNPLLPFARASIETRQKYDQTPDPVRAASLCDYGMKHLPADATLMISASPPASWQPWRRPSPRKRRTASSSSTAPRN